MNKILKYSYFIAGFVLFAGMNACVKDRNDLATDFSNLQPLLEIRDNISGIGNDAGLANFSRASLNFANDTTDTHIQSFYVNLASVNVLSKDISVTVGVDQAALDAYNADASHTTKYEMMPDSIFTLLNTTVTIAAGERVALVSIQLTPGKIDPSQSYMLPISITAADGITISGNYGTIYYHVIGNPLAGNYLQDFYRWNDVPDTTGAPNSTVFEDEPTPINPESPNTIFLPESYLQTFTGGGISLSFTNNGGVLSDFSVSFNAATLQGLSDGGFTVLTAPKLVSYQIVGDASTHYAGSTFRTYWEALNSSGGNRKLVDEFTKQ
jgi:hypothetical protein